MNITIKITYWGGTVMEVCIPVSIEKAKVTEPVAAPEEEPACTVEPDDSRPSNKAEALQDEQEQPLSYESFLAARKEDLKPSGKRYKSVAEMVEASGVFDGPLEPEQPQDTGDQFRCTDGFYSLPPNLYSDFCAAFGVTMVEQQLTLARLWCETNPQKRKTRRGMGRFLNAWMCRSQGEKRVPLNSRGSLLNTAPSQQEGW